MIKYIFLMASLVMLSSCGDNRPEKKVDFFAEMEKKMLAQKKEVNRNTILDERSISLFQERRSYEVGDIITIVLEENMNAKKNAKTSTSKSSSGTIDSPIMLGMSPKIGGPIAQKFGVDGFGDLSFGFGGANDWSGDGSSSQSNSLNGVIAAFIVGKLPNGNLKISGIKKLLINQGSETIIIDGIIRPIDIDTDNTILSTKIAGAKISYYGDGTVGNSQKIGWLSGFFNDGGWFW
jgi:flagellar L-ring protein precursor FlgH